VRRAGVFVMNLKNRPAEFFELSGSDAATLACVVVVLQSLLTLVAPGGRAVVVLHSRYGVG